MAKAIAPKVARAVNGVEVIDRVKEQVGLELRLEKLSLGLMDNTPCQWKDR